MTEAEWLTCTDPMPMLEFLRGKASDRKLRLFAVACVRHYWSHLTDERSKRAAGVAEMEADRSGGEQALRLAERDAKAAIPSLSLGFRPSEQAAAAGAMAVVHVEATEAARLACGWGRNVSVALVYEQPPHDRPSWAKNKAFADWGSKAVTLLIDLFNNPFAPTALDPAWLTPTVKQLAQAIYDTRAFDRMPSLADALEQAGCHDPDILNHCRQPGVHVRGCWLLDLVLGKE